MVVLKRTGKILGLVAALACGMFVLLTAIVSAPANAATGNMNEVLQINTTQAVVDIFHYNIDRQLMNDVPLDGYAPLAEGSSELLHLDAIRDNSALAVFVEVSLDELEALPIDKTKDRVATLAGSLLQGFVDEFNVAVSDADVDAMHTLIANRLAFGMSDELHRGVIESFELGRTDRTAAGVPLA